MEEDFLSETAQYYFQEQELPFLLTIFKNLQQREIVF